MTSAHKSGFNIAVTHLLDYNNIEFKLIMSTLQTLCILRTKYELMIHLNSNTYLILIWLTYNPTQDGSKRYLALTTKV